jgi:hypothetical protein
MWVVDLDLDPVKKVDGAATLAQISAKHGGMPKTLTAITPRGGRHLIFTWDTAWNASSDPCVSIHNSAGCGEGGYVCLPPSRNANGGSYRFDPDGEEQTASAPDWLVTLARKQPKTRAEAWARAALANECEAVATAQPGTRNDALNTAAFNLFQIVHGGGLDEQEVRDRLFEAARTCGLVADDGAPSVEATIDSAYGAARTQPRTRPQPGLKPAPQPAGSAPQSGSQSQPAQGRAIIQIVSGQFPRITNEIEDALLASGLPVFQRAGALVEPVAETTVAAGGRKTVVARLRQLCPDCRREARRPPMADD